MGNLWEIYTFHQTWPGKFEKFSHVHDSRRPKFHGPYMATTGVSPPPDMPIWWTMMCVCVQKLRGYLKLALWVWMGKMWFWSFKLVQTIKLWNTLVSSQNLRTGTGKFSVSISKYIWRRLPFPHLEMWRFKPFTMTVVAKPTSKFQMWMSGCSSPKKATDCQRRLKPTSPAPNQVHFSTFCTYPRDTKNQQFGQHQVKIKHQVGCVKTNEYQLGGGEPSFPS